MTFHKHISEMLDLVNVMAGDAPLSTKRYLCTPAGVKDKTTGVTMRIKDAGIGVLADVMHPTINPEVLESYILLIGYKVEGSDSASTRYSLIDREKTELPTSIAMDISKKSICNCEIYTKDRKKILTPIKNILETILNLEGECSEE